VEGLCCIGGTGRFSKAERENARQTETETLPSRSNGESWNTRATHGKQRNYWLTNDGQLVSILLTIVSSWGSNLNRMSLILMLCEKNNYNATKLTAYASNYKAERDESATCFAGWNIIFSSFGDSVQSSIE